MLNLKQERKKKKKKSKEIFTYSNKSRRRSLPRAFPTFIYKASGLMMSQALDIGYDKALKWKEKKSQAICFP